jgi:hypothetical protein
MKRGRSGSLLFHEPGQAILDRKHHEQNCAHHYEKDPEIEEQSRSKVEIPNQGKVRMKPQPREERTSENESQKSGPICTREPYTKEGMRLYPKHLPSLLHPRCESIEDKRTGRDEPSHESSSRKVVSP